MKNIISNIFLNKKILIYGLGKSGLSTFQFLKNKSITFLYDDNKVKNKNLDIKKNLVNHKNLSSLKIDQIILSPGIDINKCKLTKFLKKNRNKIYTDLDVFYSFSSFIFSSLNVRMKKINTINANPEGINQICVQS